MTRRKLAALGLLLTIAALDARANGGFGDSSAGTLPSSSGLSLLRGVSAKITETDEKTRRLALVQWIGVSSTQALGQPPVEVTEQIERFRSRVAELRRGQVSLQVVDLINRYELEARRLQMIREQPFIVSVPINARLTRPVREALSAVTIGTRVIATGVGANLNQRNEPTLIVLTTDLTEAPPGLRGAPPTAAAAAGGSGATTNTTPNPTSRVFATVLGTVISLNPLAVRADNNTVVGLAPDPSTNVGFQRSAPMALAEFKVGDWVEVVTVPVLGTLTVQEMRLSKTPLRPMP